MPALVLPTKQGDMYVLDRRTGQPLTGIERRAVPGGGVEPDQRTPTQPFSRFHTVRKSDLTARNMWGLTPVDQLACRIEFRQADYRGVYTPPSAKRPWIEYPGYNGGSDWGGIAIDTARGVIVANYNDIPNYDRMVPRAQAQKAGWKPRDENDSDNQAGPETTGFAQLDTPYGYTINAGWRMAFTEMPCKEPPYGGIQAVDLKTGKTLWDRPLGTALRNGPFGLSSHLPFTIGTPNNGGSVVTASGLVFVAAATDDLLRAIDLKTGKTLWTAKLPAGGQATPIVYSVQWTRVRGDHGRRASLHGNTGRRFAGGVRTAEVGTTARALMARARAVVRPLHWLSSGWPAAGSVLSPPFGLGSHAQRSGQCQGGSSSMPWPTMRVWLSSFSSCRALHAASASSAAISRAACDTTHTWLRREACTISRANAGSRSGCRLVSGSFSTISGGGRGVCSAAIHSR